MRNTQHTMAHERFARGGSADLGGWPFCVWNHVSPEHALSLDPALAQAPVSQQPGSAARKEQEKKEALSAALHAVCAHLSPRRHTSWFLVSSCVRGGGPGACRGRGSGRRQEKGILWKACSKGVRVGTADPAGAGAAQTETLMACGAISSHCPGQTRKDQ